MSVRIIFLVLTVPLLMGSEVYRYVDSDGVVTYAQQLPYGVQGERITAVAGAATQSAPAVPVVEKPPEPVLSPQQQAMLDKLKAADQARKDEIAQIREANCARSQEVLANLSVSARIRVKGPDGQEVRMPEEERQVRIAEAQAGIVANCTPPEDPRCNGRTCSGAERRQYERLIQATASPSDNQINAAIRPVTPSRRYE